MRGIFTHIYHENQRNVQIYQSHGSYGLYNYVVFQQWTTFFGATSPLKSMKRSKLILKKTGVAGGRSWKWSHRMTPMDLLSRSLPPTHLPLSTVCPNYCKVLSRVIPGTPKDIGPPSGKPDPYTSHIFRDSYGSVMGIVWAQGVPCPWGSIVVGSIFTNTPLQAAPPCDDTRRYQTFVWVSSVHWQHSPTPMPKIASLR